MPADPDVQPIVYERQEPAFKPLPPVARIALVVFGTLALGLGVVGLVLPVLPTTPFLLIATGCYVRSSERLFNWLVHHPRLGPSIRGYVEKKGIPLRVKVISLAIAWAVLGGTALFVVERWPLKLVLFAVAVAKTVFMICIKTLSADASENKQGSAQREPRERPMTNRPSRMAREARTVEAMIRLYCRAKHDGEVPLCSECGELWQYAQMRLDRCPYQEGKTTCGKCPVHCYKPAKREQVRAVMRYAGPRMLYRHPVMALLHLFDGLRKEPVRPRREAGR